MSELTLQEFRVQNFKNIDDSGWVPVERITTFLGRNEAGKTALLKALHRFNPATPEAYEPQRDFPRLRYTSEFRDAGDWPGVSCRLAIGETLQAELAEIAHPQEAPQRLTATRYYDGSLKLEFDPPIGEDAVALRDVIEPLERLGDEAMSLAAPSPEQDESYDAIRRDLLAWVAASKAAVLALPSLDDPAAAALLNRINGEAMAKGRPETKAAIQAFLDAITGPLLALSRPALAERLAKAVEARLPVFIYFDNAGVLDSAVYLPELIADLERRPNDMGVRTVNAMFKHVGLSAQEVADLGRSQAREKRLGGEPASPEVIRLDQERATLRSIKLGSASADITRRFSEWWRQQRHAIRYHADGDFFRIWVADDRRPAVEVELESRSEGFRWFFSFYLVFLGETDALQKDAVLLLDSPGLHLHPSAQRELLGLLERLGEKNQILYSTHSPFLIDGGHLERLRPISRDEDGRFKVCAGEWPKDREAIYPLQAAAGYTLMRAMFEERRTLLVRDGVDHLYLTMLAQLCRRSGRMALPDDVNLMPCGGATMIPKIAALFLGQERPPVILLDGDADSLAVEEKLVREFYQGQERQILRLDSILDRPGATIEDLFGEILVLGAFEKVLGKSMLMLPVDRATGSVLDHATAAAKRLGLALPENWRMELARQIAKDWASKDPRDVPSVFLDRAQALFAEVNARLEGTASIPPAETPAPAHLARAS